MIPYSRGDMYTQCIYLRSETNRWLRYKPDVNSHRVTPEIMRAGPKKGMRYRLDVRISLREYGIKVDE